MLLEGLDEIMKNPIPGRDSSLPPEPNYAIELVAPLLFNLEVQNANFGP
jgi:hypothetical protein